MKKLLLILVLILGIYLWYGHSSVFGSVSVSPNAQLTPGETNYAVNQQNIQKTICVSGWTATIRPSVGYTNNLKAEQIYEYRYTDTKLASYEEDHFIPLELGGNPVDPHNLWPQPYPQAHYKDQVENFLHKQVCGGSMTLEEAQREIRTNWYAIYLTNLKGKVGGISSDDPDDL